MGWRGAGMFVIMFGLLAAVGFIQSWPLAFTILNLCLISAILSLGVNIQWGYAGLLNVGVMGFVALGGMAGIVLIALITVGIVWWLSRQLRGKLRIAVIALVLLVGAFVARSVFDPAVEAIEAVDSSRTGYLGGLGLPILFSWIVGGFFAAGAAWLIGKVSLGLRSDYLAIATLGISEIIIAVLKNEDWLTRGVKNVTGLERPVPYEVDLQASPWLMDMAERLNMSIVDVASVAVKLCYAGLFLAVLLIVLTLSEKALHSPWGRVMRAIRDNEVAAEAMGKDVTARHLQVFVLGLKSAAHMRLMTMGAILLLVLRFAPKGLIPER